MNENKITLELNSFCREIIKKYPELKLSVAANLSLTFISNTPQDYKRYEFDIVVNKNGKPFIIIEVKSNSFLQNQISTSLSAIAKPALDLTNASYYIFTDGEVFKLIDGTNFLDCTPIAKESISSLFDKSPEYEEIKKNYELLRSEIKKYFEENSLIEKWNKLFENKKIEEFFEYDRDSNAYKFIDDNVKTENDFFISLLPEYNEDVVYRYTSVSSLESSLKYNSYRMSGIVAMNDSTEVDYADVYIFGGRKPLDEWDKHDVEKINNVFISSCAAKEKEDDLTLWRLYGEDSKGVSYKLQIDRTKLNENMILAHVSYGTKSGHKELDLLKYLLVGFNQNTSARFSFRNYETWKHFFKPYQYEVEREVRLLYILNDTVKPLKKDWVVTYGDKIFNPVVDFKLNGENFPLHIKEIILGPNTPERNVNKAQLEEYIRQLKLETRYSLNDLDVKLSDINNYRKS